MGGSCVNCNIFGSSICASSDLSLSISVLNITHHKWGVPRHNPQFSWTFVVESYCSDAYVENIKEKQSKKRKGGPVHRYLHSTTCQEIRGVPTER